MDRAGRDLIRKEMDDAGVTCTVSLIRSAGWSDEFASGSG